MKTHYYTRFGNRKLYNRQTSKYCSSMDLVRDICAGNNVQCYDRRSKENVEKKILQGYLNHVYKDELKTKSRQEIFELVRSKKGYEPSFIIDAKLKGSREKLSQEIKKIA